MCQIGTIDVANVSLFAEGSKGKLLCEVMFYYIFFILLGEFYVV